MVGFDVTLNNDLSALSSCKSSESGYGKIWEPQQIAHATPGDGGAAVLIESELQPYLG